ncbi:MAG TPA: DUF58 domain-containing protein, partial [Candidatus Limnocylindrales bacterium]|nr:DUF58 domain-containing protein [Candidatus Limnocylindrales bacterium]
MTSRLSSLGVTMLALVAWALWLGVLTGRVEALLIAVPLLIGLVRSGTRMTPPSYSITHEASTARLFEGESVTVTVTVTAAAALRQIEILEPLPASVEVVTGSNRVVLALEPGETARFTYEIRVPAWLHLTLGTLQIRTWEPSGLRAIETRYHAPKSVRVYPRPAPLRRLPAPLRTQSSVGNYVSAVIGEGLEPGEIRPFAPGDRVRHVNWRASLRLGRLHVTRHQEERNADVVLMLDTLSRAGAGTASTLQAGVRAAASLAGAYLHRKDRVGLIEYGGVFRWVKPGTGRAQLERVLDTL